MVTSRALLIGIVLWAVEGIGCCEGEPRIIAEGNWSKPVIDTRGYAVRGRLVLCEKPAREDLREVIAYVELQDACDFVGNGMQLFCDLGETDFRPEYQGGLRCEMRDKDKRLVSSTGGPFSGAVPLSEWVGLPTDATVRLRASPFGIRRAKAMAISPEVNKLWVISDDDPNEYFLSGTFVVAPQDEAKPKGEGHVWSGTIELPPMRIVGQRK